MPIEAPLRAAHFYDCIPVPDHRSGDIWHGLPTFGLLLDGFTRGVVITPACDLANRKCETLTFLPIICASKYLGSPAFRNECWLEIEALITRFELVDQHPRPTRFGLFPSAIIEEIIDAPTDQKGKTISKDERARISGYLEYLQASERGDASATHLAKFVKADRLKGILSRLVTNSLKADIHFLPQESTSAEYSPTPTHSVVLFRYPITIPIDTLDRAQNSTEEHWKTLTAATDATGILPHMRQWPIKLATLKGEFFADMISRYLNMYIRLGSTDFQEQSVREMAEDIRGQE